MAIVGQCGLSLSLSLCQDVFCLFSYLCLFVKMFFFPFYRSLSLCQDVFYFLISSLCQDGEEDGEMETVAAKMSSDRSCQVGQKTKRPN